MTAAGRRLLVVGLGALLGAAPPGVRIRAESLTVATYNVENYDAAGRRVEGVYRGAYPNPEDAKAALRRVIRALDADVLALQEMGPAGYLAELQRDLRAEGVDYPHAALAEAADAERHLAVLSRRPLRRVRVHDDLTFPYLAGREKVKRGLLEVEVAAGGGGLTVFVVHLKSRYTDRRDDPESARRRAGEAGAIRDRILAGCPRPAATRFLLVGDCNDTADSRAVRLLAKRGRTLVAGALPAADPRGDTWTHAHRGSGSYRRVDFIFASPGLLPAVRGGAAGVYDGPGVREASDHRPVVVRLEFP